MKNVRMGINRSCMKQYFSVMANINSIVSAICLYMRKFTCLNATEIPDNLHLFYVFKINS
jgi:hypothetical protein